MNLIAKQSLTLQVQPPESIPANKKGETAKTLSPFNLLSFSLITVHTQKLNAHNL